MLFILLRDYKILFGVPPNFLLHKVVRDAKKVEKDCSRQYAFHTGCRKEVVAFRWPIFCWYQH